MGRFAWGEGWLKERDVLKYVLTEYGAQSVTPDGTDMKLKWYADSWDILLLVSMQYIPLEIYLLVNT